MENNDFVSIVKEEVFNYFSKNKLLMKKYSTAWLKDRINKNIKEFYTSEQIGATNGWYDLWNSRIVICRKKDDKPDVTMDDIKADEGKMFTLMHEATHAILKNKQGTGILKITEKEESKHNRIADVFLEKGETTFPEIGRGINEGFTNWLVEKGGMETETYPFLTSIVRQIESCIGENEVIKFSSGDYDQIFKSLNMDKIYGYEFLRQLDSIYEVQEKLTGIIIVENYLITAIDNAEKGKNSDLDKKEEEEEKEKAQNCSFYSLLIPEDVKKRINELQESIENGDESAKNEKLELFKQLFYEAENKYEIPNNAVEKMLIKETEEKLINSLFFERVNNDGSVNELARLRWFVEEVKYQLQAYEITSDCLDEATRQLDEVDKKALKIIRGEVDQLIATGNLTPKQLKEKYRRVKLILGEESDDSQATLSTAFANLITINRPNVTEQKIMIKYAIDTDNIDKIANFKVQITENGMAIIYDGNEVKDIVRADAYAMVEEKSNRDLKIGEHFEDKVNWTIQSDYKNSFRILVHKFEQLRMEKLLQDPMVKVKICNGIIVFDHGTSKEIYNIKEGENPEIIPIKAKTQEPVSSMVVQEHKAKNVEYLPMVVKENFRSKFIKKMKNVFAVLIEKKEKKQPEVVVKRDSKESQSTAESQKFAERLIVQKDKDSKNMQNSGRQITAEPKKNKITQDIERE